MNIRLWTSVSVAGAALAATAAIRSVTPAPQNADENGWWMKRHREKLATIAQGNVGKIVFLGDSITHAWERPAPLPEWKRWFTEEPYHALNLGFGGDRTEHVLWRIDHGELDGYDARVVVLMIGTNNTGHFPREKEPPCDTILGIREILKRIAIHQPKAVTLLLPIFPRGHRPDDPCRLRNDTVNRSLRHFADGRRVVWVDFTDQFLYPDGTLPVELMNDFLHFTAGSSQDSGGDGFDIWAAAVLPYMERILARPEGDFTVLPNRYPAHTSPRYFFSERPTAVQPYTRFFAYSSSRGEEWWTRRMLEKRSQIADSNGEFDLVMLGDSITHFWELSGGEAYAALTNAYSVLNLGYGGDNTRQVIWRTLNGELDGYRAKLVMLMIGTNNHNDTPQEIAAGVRRILDIIAERQPDAVTLLLPVFPRDLHFKGEEASKCAKLAKASDLMAKFADGAKVRWLDFNAKFLGPDGKIVPSLYADGLHLRPEGYAVWREAIAPTLKEVCGK